MYQGLVRVTLVGWFSQILGGWENWGWLEWMGGLVTFPPVDGEDGVNRLGTSRLEVDEVGVGGLGGCSSFPVVVRIPYDGFLWENGVVTPETGQTARRNDSGMFWR
jgi:hypothetical protein